MRHKSTLVVVHLIVWFVVCRASSWAQQEPAVLSLADAIDLALAHNPGLESSQQQVAAKAAQETQARANFLPKLDMGESFSRSDSPTYAFSSKLNQGRLTQSDLALDRLNHPAALDNFRSHLSFVQPLYTGGKTSLATAQARLQHEASAYARDRQQQEVIFQVAKAYYGILLAQENLAMVQSALKTADANMHLAHDRFTAGLVVESDVLSAQVRLASLHEQEILTQQQLTLAYATLNDALGLSLTEQWTLSDSLRHHPTQFADLAALEAQALEKRADFAQLCAEEQAAERSIGLAQAAFLPSVNAIAQYEINNFHFATSGQDNWFVGVVFQWNLFNGRADVARVAEAQAQLKQMQAQRKRLASSIQLAVKEAFFHWKAAGARIEVANAAISQAEMALRIVTDRYQAGLTTIVDLLGTETALTQARGNLARALYDQIVGLASVELAVGTISKERL